MKLQVRVRWLDVGGVSGHDESSDEARASLTIIGPTVTLT